MAGPNTTASASTTSATTETPSSIEFRSPIDLQDVIVERDMLNWFDDWVVAAHDVLNPLGYGANLSESLVEVTAIEV